MHSTKETQHGLSFLRKLPGNLQRLYGQPQYKNLKTELEEKYAKPRNPTNHIPDLGFMTRYYVADCID